MDADVAVEEDGLEDVDSRIVVIQRLRDSGFNWSDVANILSVDRRTLLRWRKETQFDDLPQNATIGSFIIAFVMNNFVNFK